MARFQQAVHKGSGDDCKTKACFLSNFGSFPVETRQERILINKLCRLREVCTGERKKGKDDVRQRRTRKSAKDATIRYAPRTQDGGAPKTPKREQLESDASIE